MTTRPATPLPWKSDPTGDCGPDWIGIDGHFVLEGTEFPEDAAYIVHAANSYPRLVEALRKILAGEFGNVSLEAMERAGGGSYWSKAAGLLRELEGSSE